MVDDDLVPIGVFFSGGGYYRLKIVVVSIVMPDAVNVPSRPHRRSAADFPEDHLGEEIRPVPGAEVDEVLNTAFAIERGADAQVRRQHHVRLAVIAGDDADILVNRAGWPRYSAKMQLPVLRRHANVRIVPHQPTRTMPYPRIKLRLVEAFRQNGAGNNADGIHRAGRLGVCGGYE